MLLAVLQNLVSKLKKAQGYYGINTSSPGWGVVVDLGLSKFLGILLEHGIQCRISREELLEYYLEAPTYENDII